MPIGARTRSATELPRLGRQSGSEVKEVVSQRAGVLPLMCNGVSHVGPSRTLGEGAGAAQYTSDMLLDDETTWPREVVRFIEENRALFDDWHRPASEARERDRKPGDHSSGPRFPWQQHDHAVGRLGALLKPHTLEPGYHCTRLTDPELEAIRTGGMRLQNAKLLADRIRVLEQEGVIDAEAAVALIGDNQADAANRAGMLWFCFFPPHLAGESGIEIFLRYWGGEALSRSHYQDSVRGPLLRPIGRPCLVVADVPIAGLSEVFGLSVKLIRRYFLNRGGRIAEEIDHEGFATTALPASSIRRIVCFPEPEFVDLTKCGTWRRPLAPDIETS